MNRYLHPLEIEWALAEINKHDRPDIHTHNDGDLYDILVSSYVSYLNGEVDINGKHNFYYTDLNPEYNNMTMTLVTFKAKTYAKGPVRHNRWMEWVLA